MGVQVRIVLYAPSRQVAETAVIAAYKRVAELEDIMSDYRPTSELMRLSARSGGGPVKVSPDLFRVLAISQTIHKRSGGAFDVTVGPLVKLWRRARRDGRLPHPDSIRAARRRIGMKLMRLDEREQTVQLLRPGMQLDLGGIAKGYAADALMAELQRHGIQRAMAVLGGDHIFSGPPPDAQGWQLEVADADSAHRRLSAAYTAISSSGDTEQFMEFEGMRYSHVIDPRTGTPLTSRSAATLSAPCATLTDALSTTLTVLGDERGAAFMKRYYPTLQYYIRTVGPAGASGTTPKTAP